MRPEIISWASQTDACLVEVHSHGERGTAGFSPSDVWGFEEWVPHVRWRLRARPYAAVVTAGATLDAIAWLEDSAEHSQIERIEIGPAGCEATGWTLPRWSELKELRREQ
jgi:hypothetical protein